MKVLKTFRPDFDIPLRSSNVNVKLLEKIYQEKTANIESNDRWWEEVDFHRQFEEQIDMEISGKVKIQSINAPENLDAKLVGICSIDVFESSNVFIFRSNDTKIS